MELKNSEHTKEEEKINRLKVSMSTKSMESKLTKSQMKIEDEENPVQDIILGSKESSNVGPIRTANPNSSSVGPDNHNTSRYHPYSWWGHPLHINHPNFGRGMGMSSWPGHSGGFGNYPRGGFGWFMDRPYCN